jgi:mRNA interferase MazF
VVSRGDVCWLELPDEKRRPALVLTREGAVPVMRRVIVCYLTTRIRDLPTEVQLGPEDGMPQECAVNLDNLRAVRKAFLTERITTLPGPRMHQVCRALAIATGCD